jgi:hypothetical protein
MMFRALLYKEWVKLRLYWLLLSAASWVFQGYLCLRLRQVYALNEPVMLWNNWINKGYLFFRAVQYVPLLVGLALACFQFFPEVQAKRFRLILHLPLREETSVMAHLAAGIVLLTASFAPGALLLGLTSALYFPAEFQHVFWLTIAPWVLAGYAAYLLAATTILEPAWRQRVIHVLLGAGVLRLLFFEDFYNSYDRLLPWAALLVAALALLPLLSSDRFGKGYGS